MEQLVKRIGYFIGGIFLLNIFFALISNDNSNNQVVNNKTVKNNNQKDSSYMKIIGDLKWTDTIDDIKERLTNCPSNGGWSIGYKNGSKRLPNGYSPVQTDSEKKDDYAEDCEMIVGNVPWLFFDTSLGNYSNGIYDLGNRTDFLKFGFWTRRDYMGIEKAIINKYPKCNMSEVEVRDKEYHFYGGESGRGNYVSNKHYCSKYTAFTLSDVRDDDPKILLKPTKYTLLEHQKLESEFEKLRIDSYGKPTENINSGEL